AQDLRAHPRSPAPPGPARPRWKSPRPERKNVLMAINVDIPELGESVREAVLIKWHKNDGDSVAVAEPIAELETDKANVDVPAPAAGVLRHVKEEGATVTIGDTIARIEEGNGTAAGSASAKAQATAKASSPATARASAPSAPAPRAES